MACRQYRIDGNAVQVTISATQMSYANAVKHSYYITTITHLNGIKVGLLDLQSSKIELVYKKIKMAMH